MCTDCTRLSLVAERATERHLSIVTRLQEATIAGELDLLPALEAAVREAARTRVKAMDEYRFHTASHRAMESGGAA
jgi:hypothetical protein